MADNNLATVHNSSGEEANKNRLNLTWIILLVAYALLLIGTGYIAFFQPQYNPATAIDEAISAQIADENTRTLTIEALKEEGLAFKARQELAVQSFNIVLGAVLGFLSATAAQFITRRGAG